MADELKLIGVGRLKLSQRRFQNGALYVSAIVEGESVNAIDCRFFMEEGSDLRPTRKGFRVHREEIQSFKKLVSAPPNEVAEHTLWAASTRKLIARRCDDEYGKGVDFRYFKNSNVYKGWEKRGIRLNDADFTRLALIVRESGLLDCRVPTTTDLFRGKTIAASRPASESKQEERRMPTPAIGGVDPWTPVGEALSEFLAEE